MIGSAFIDSVKDTGKESKLICILEGHLAQEVYSSLGS